jgi:hypothetical protein
MKKDKAIITVEKTNKPKLYYGISLDPILSGVYNFGGEFDKIKMDGIPLAIRNVPIHKDDWTPESYKGPIAQDELSNRKVSATGAGKAFVGYGTDDLRVESGIIGMIYGTSQELCERDYTIDPSTGMRRQGAAYTFMEQNDIKLSYGFFIQGELKLHDESLKKLKDKIYLHAEYRRLSENYGIVTGWDRYNKLEVYKRYDIATIVMNQLEAGLEYRDKHKSIGLFVGRTIPQLMKTSELGKLMEISTPSFTYVRFGYGLSLDTRNKKHK